MKLVEAGLRNGMTQDEAERAARDAVRRQEWRLRRGGVFCPGCQKTKPVKDFGRNSSRENGLQVYCRRCR